MPEIENRRAVEKAGLRIYEGRLCGVEIAAVFSGVCKVNAAVAAQILVDAFGVDVMINAGTAGGIDPKLRIFDAVISTEACYHDVAGDILTEYHPWMKSVFFQADPQLIDMSKAAVEKAGLGERVFWGRMVTGESFIADEGRQRIIDEFAPLTADMETASIAHVCYVSRIPFIAVRCVTDTAEHKGIGHFEENCAQASVIAKNIAAALINQLGSACKSAKDLDS